jgi:hypothetical protein
MNEGQKGTDYYWQMLIEDFLLCLFPFCFAGVKLDFINIMLLRGC